MILIRKGLLIHNYAVSTNTRNINLKTKVQSERPTSNVLLAKTWTSE